MMVCDVCNVTEGLWPFVTQLPRNMHPRHHKSLSRSVSRKPWCWRQETTASQGDVEPRMCVALSSTPPSFDHQHGACGWRQWTWRDLAGFSWSHKLIIHIIHIIHRFISFHNIPHKRDGQESWSYYPGILSWHRCVSESSEAFDFWSP